MDPMITALEQIVEHLRVLGRKAPTLLQAPLSPGEIETLVSGLPFLLTRELETIYQWHNGTEAAEGDLLDDLYLFPGAYFLSLEEAVQTYHERKQSPQWQENWFPLFADGGGDFYLVTCSLSKLDSGEIIGFIHGEPDQSVEYENVTALARTIEAALAAKAIYLDTDNSLDFDDERYAEIARAMNPGVPEWQD